MLDRRGVEKVGELITLTEAADRAGVSLMTLRKIVRENKITLYRNPRDAREKLVRPGDIDAAMEPTPFQQEHETKKAAA
jgi:excisionase family DNA binding protein